MRPYMKAGLILTLVLFLFTSASAQESGSLFGVAVDENNRTLEKATVYLDSPQMMMLKMYITPASGKFWFPQLPSGTYSLKVERPGYRTSIFKDIIISPGLSVRIQTVMEAVSSLEEETEAFVSPMTDSFSARSAVIIDRDLITLLPFQRNLANVISSAPGVLQIGGDYLRSFAVHGGSSRDNRFAVNGVSLNNPDSGTLLSDLDYESIEGIEVVTAGQSPVYSGASGGYLNIISKAGQNDFYYGFRIDQAGGSFSRSLFSDEEITSLGTSQPIRDKTLWDFSLSLGGSLMKDRAWYYTSFGWNYQVRTTPFIPWTDPSGKTQNAYDWKGDNKYIFARISAYPYPNLTMGLYFYLTNRYQSRAAEYLSWNTTSEATRVLDQESSIFGGLLVNYAFNQNASLALRGGILQTKVPFLLSEATMASARYYDALTGHTWGSGSYNDKQTLKRFDAQGAISVFYGPRGLDGLLKLGVDYEFISRESSYWKENNLTMIYSGGSPYLYGTALSSQSGETVGKGLISFSSVSRTEDSYGLKNELRKIGAFGENSVSIGRRLTLNLGFRFERSIGRFPSFAKSSSGNPVSVNFGEDSIIPLVDANPFGTIFVPEWQHIMTWNSFSPQAGLVFDLFGNGKTLVKATWARYADTLTLSYLRALNALNPDIPHYFFWYDENMDGLVDEDDSLDFTNEDFRAIGESHYFQRSAPDLKPPNTFEYSAGLEQQLFRDFSISVRYINRNTNNLLETVLYDPEGDREWSSLDTAPQEWWVPFSTIVPGSGEFSDTPVTLYYFSDSAPQLFYRLNNVPDLKRSYEALELTFRKRMSNNWQMNGSITWGKSTGTLGQGLSFRSPATTAASTPNAFVNLTENSRLDYDRPLVIKLMGAAVLPWDFTLSFFFSHVSGLPLIRSTSVLPPDEWLAANNVYPTYMSVLLEEPGARRTESTNNLDLRISKDFRIAQRAKLTFALDILNVLGETQEIYMQNDSGYWYPSAEGTAAGRRVTNPYYNQAVSLSGTRTFRFSIRIGF